MSELGKRTGIVKRTTDLERPRPRRHGGQHALKLTGGNQRNVTLGFHAPQRPHPAPVQHPKPVL